MLSITTYTVAAPSYRATTTYQCTSDSPTRDHAYSRNTDPPVALTHIFCGDFAPNGKAQGFHSRYLAYRNNGPREVNHPQCAYATGKITQNGKEVKHGIGMDGRCTFYSEGISVLSAYERHDPNNANILIFPPRTTYITKDPKGRLNKFFPDNWTPAFIVEIALRIYHACAEGRGGTGRVCMRNYENERCRSSVTKMPEKISIMIFFDRQNINSAFPTDDHCTCDYEKPEVRRQFDELRLEIQ